MKTNQHTIAVLPGFGCDSTIFNRLELPTENILRLEWITPLKKESIEQYASRMITDEMRGNHQLILIGHSFGGVIMQEIARILNTQKIILISSIVSKEGLSKGLNLVRKLQLHIWVHKTTMKGTIWMWRRGAGLQNEMKPKFKKSMSEIENKYFSWAVKNLAGWKQSLPNDLNPSLILGSDDGIFSLKKAHNPIVIKGGNHMMLFNKPKEVSKIIQQLVSEYSTNPQ